MKNKYDRLPRVEELVWEECGVFLEGWQFGIALKM
jgi:hypothetical protein